MGLLCAQAKGENDEKQNKNTVVDNGSDDYEFVIRL